VLSIVKIHGKLTTDFLCRPCSFSHFTAALSCRDSWWQW